MSTIVKTQTELDTAIKAGATDIIIDSPAGVWIQLRDSSSVEARGSARVEARDSARVVAWDSASVEARDSASVEARGSASVEAGKYVAVHLHSQRVTLTGGVVIDMTKVDATVLADWSDLTGVQPDSDGFLTVYKAVNDDLLSGYGFQYSIGETVTDPKWRDDHDCGGGLHFSPTPRAAKEYFTSATRFLECRVAVADVRCIDSSKLKARSAAVVREVDLWTREAVQPS